MSLIDSVVAFGKIFFIPRGESIPQLPRMSLLFLKDGGQGAVFPWRAACIDLEMDASGTSIKNAANNLKKSLLMYIDMERKAADGSFIEAARIITKAAFSKSKQKKEYFDVYRQAKEKYIIQAIEEQAKEEEKRRQEKLRIEKEAFNKINDAIWKKIMATYPSQFEKYLPKQPVSEIPNKKTLSTPAVNQNWFPIYTPSNSSRIQIEMWNNSNWENLLKAQSDLLPRQLAHNV
jgi:hypothetical protein